MIFLKFLPAFVLITVLTEAKAETNKPFRIAALYPNESMDRDFSCITKGYFEHMNAQHKMNVELEIFDSSNDAMSTLAVAKKIAAAGFDGVVGARTSVEALAASDILNAAKIPLIVPVAGHPDITKNHPYVVRLMASSNQYARLLAKYTNNATRLNRS